MSPADYPQSFAFGEPDLGSAALERKKAKQKLKNNST